MQARSAHRKSPGLISRRGILLTPFVLAAQRQWKAAVIQELLPQGLMEQSIIFPRAYTCCPRRELARESIRTGRFPHALHGDEFSSVLPAFDDDPVNAPRGMILAYVTPVGDGADTPFERSVKVPLAIFAPDLLEPRTAKEILISTADLAPTLLGLCGLAVPDSVQGRDLSGVLLGRKEDLPDSVYVEGGVGTGNEWRMVIRGFDKLVMDLSGNVTHLYNLAEDPGEQMNLAQDAAEQLKRDALIALARVWMRKLGDGIDPSGLKKRA
jgi:hypothetical protein